jgi:hypothetical protein
MDDGRWYEDLRLPPGSPRAGSVLVARGACGSSPHLGRQDVAEAREPLSREATPGWP